MNINFMDLEKLIDIAERSNVNSLEVTDGDLRISIICRSDNANSNSSSHSSKHGFDNSFSANQSTIASNKDSKNHIDDTSLSKEKTDKDSQNQITAPMLGTFYRRSAPSADEFVQVGANVEQGQTICIIEAMKMMHEVKADFACTIKKVLVEEGDVVEYGQPLFIIIAAD